MLEDFEHTGMNVDFLMEVDEELIEPMKNITKLLENGLSNVDITDEDAFTEISDMLSGARVSMVRCLKWFDYLASTHCQRAFNKKHKKKEEHIEHGK
jgi:hypothetical protein